MKPKAAFSPSSIICPSPKVTSSTNDINFLEMLTDTPVRMITFFGVEPVIGVFYTTDLAIVRLLPRNSRAISTSSLPSTLYK